jgi:hypothetical protein
MMKISILKEVADEREFQDSKWGQQNHPDGTGEWMAERAEMYRGICELNAKEGVIEWLDILREEVYEAFAEENPKKLRAELIQIAAVALAWVEAIDRRTD